MLVADDLGTETLAAYGFGQPTAVTPNIDALARDGLLIRDFWAQPTCSPTRDAIMTADTPSEPAYAVHCVLASDPHEINPLALDGLSDPDRRNYDELKRIYAGLLASEDTEAVTR